MLNSIVYPLIYIPLNGTHGDLLRILWQLITLPISLWLRITHIPERPVKATREFGRITHQGHMGEFVLNQGSFYGLWENIIRGTDAVVHHVAGGNDVGSGLGMGEGNFGQDLDATFVVDSV
jgi:hypothetical protein